MGIAIVLLVIATAVVVFWSIFSVSKQLSIAVISTIFFCIAIAMIVWQGFTQQTFKNLGIVAVILFVIRNRLSISMPATTKARDYLKVRPTLLNSDFFCEKCKTKLPYYRIPRNFNQLLAGGWTCPSCGTELDRNGKVKFKKVRKDNAG